MPWLYLTALLMANLALLLPAGTPIRVTGALLLICFLPGLGWAGKFLPTQSFSTRIATAAALSYGLTLLTTLLLHYLPGSVDTWQLLIGLNVAAIWPFFFTAYTSPNSDASSTAIPISISSIPMLLILLAALFLRMANLDYSEFQGDEALALISAAEALEGHEDALFLRSKGPAEVLLPMALWRLTGIINEPIARLPFTIASVLAIVTIYLVGCVLRGPRAGWLAAAFFSLNGFAVAFGRIVQYQALVLWLSSMAFLMVLQWSRTRHKRLAFVGGVCLGAGLLAHYDAVLVLPAVGWLFVGTWRADFMFPEPGPMRNVQRFIRRFVSDLTPFLVGLLIIALPFYLPFSLDPQANRTGDYVGGRIGSELRNSLPDFFHFNTFYSSFYNIIFTGLLVFGLLFCLLWRARRGRGWLAALIGFTVLAVTFLPNMLAGETFNLSFLPFALFFLGALFALSVSRTALQALIVWLAVPFLGYNFVVALGLTHIYTIVPAWSVLAAVAWHQLQLPLTNGPLSRLKLAPLKVSALIFNTLFAIFFSVSTIFLWNAFVRHDVEYWQDYPLGNLLWFWSPFDEPPAAGFFGFAHRAGWKAIGQKVVSRELAGDYGSNEEPDVTTWYTRGAPRSCDSRPEYYFLAEDLIDPIEAPAETIETNYTQIGQVTLSNHKQMKILQQIPTRLNLGDLDDAVLSSQFDDTATPAAFARSARGSVPLKANFSNLVQLIGYDLDTRRAYPGGRVPVTLYWQALTSIPASYQVFTHLENEASGLIAQADGVPVCWSYPTNLWRPGQIIADQHAIPLPLDVAAGRYPLHIGLYLTDTFERLDILDEAGNPAGTSLVLEMVEIRGD